MTQTEPKNVPEGRDPDDLTSEEAAEELAGEEFTGVHVLGEQDLQKHFGSLDKDSDGEGDGRQSEG